MSLFLKNSKKYNDELLTLSFLKELSKKKVCDSKKTVSIESNSTEMAEIIAKKLLDKVQKELVLK
jgi:hypothetical protein